MPSANHNALGPDSSDRFLTLREVLHRTSLGRATLYRAIAARRFPAAVRLVPGGRVGWRESDIAGWSVDPPDWAPPTRHPSRLSGTLSTKQREGTASVGEVLS